ncbi:MAG: phosphatidylserine/phosphatidylglycerophosphate/cardiolipin synthase family protein [Bdellovibrionales bacterium]|nr:phosphatidylserine/phosphatidylglycerophosphate/cardiolipin synthase family protein [Bdellovibrionales bacterium]
MSWQIEDVLFDGDRYFDSLFLEWQKAKDTIDFEVYIFENDPIGQQVETALLNAASRGVRVRMIVDGIGSSGWWQTRGKELENKSAGGIEIRVYHPLHITELWRRLLIDFHIISPEHRPKKSLVLRRLNRRIHRKVSLVDNKIAHVGSINVSKVHSERISGDSAWRDTAARVTGPHVADLKFAFSHTWIRSHPIHATYGPRPSRLRFLFSARSKGPDSLVALNFTRRLRRFHRLKFVRRIDLAQQRVWIENAYLAPPSNIVRKLVHAAKRGVDVRILVPNRSDVWFMPLIARAYYRPLLKGGIRVFEYQNRFLHAKSLIIDDSVTIGTSNMNRRSFLHDLEVDVTLNHADSVHIMCRQFEIDLQNAIEIKSRGTVVGSRLGRLLNYLIRYWV